MQFTTFLTTQLKRIVAFKLSFFTVIWVRNVSKSHKIVLMYTETPVKERKYK